MARRKGWDQLSDGYRARLTRQGISQAAYESGTSLQRARGHSTPGNIGERTYSNLRKMADSLRWDAGEVGRDMVDEALASGQTPEWIRERLNQRLADRDHYRGQKNKAPGKANWDRRKPYLPKSWYWYH